MTSHADTLKNVHANGIFDTELLQQLVHIMQCVAMQNVNEIRERAEKATATYSINVQDAFRAAIGRVRGWDRMVIAAEK